MGGVGGLIDQLYWLDNAGQLTNCHLVAEVAALFIITLVPAVLPGLDASQPLSRWLGYESNFAIYKWNIKQIQLLLKFLSHY